MDIGAKVACDPFPTCFVNSGLRDSAAVSFGSSEEVFFDEVLLDNRLQMRVFPCNCEVS